MTFSTVLMRTRQLKIVSAAAREHHKRCSFLRDFRQYNFVKCARIPGRISDWI